MFSKITERVDDMKSKGAKKVKLLWLKFSEDFAWKIKRKEHSPTKIVPMKIFADEKFYLPNTFF